MTIQGSQPTDLQFLSPLGFQFTIKKLPNVSYFCQNVKIPGVSFPNATFPTPVTVIPMVGTRLSYEPLTLRFKVNENLENYIEVYNWLIGMGHPTTTEQTREFSLQAAKAVPGLKVGMERTFISDGTLIIQTAMKNPNYLVSFRDIFPVSLTELEFNSTAQDVEYLEAVVTFLHSGYSFERA